IVSRTLRFMTEGILLFFYGEAIRVFIFKWFNWISIAFVVLLVGGFWLVHRYGKHAHREVEEETGS
ncbi:MAG: hypothetical protein OQK55_01325, partial [Thermoanaerobaculales bacterium]|nr:hypothetical protein [Thermoanaerobaculales bacterium]